MPRSYDIFNGDADGLCALHQLRLEDPRQSELVTGVKRDIALLDRVDAQRGDELTVLDISMKTNAAALARVLGRGASVRYFDHHAAGDVPRQLGLEAHIDISPGVCTSLIVDRYIGSRQRMWAVVGAFGDNLIGPAVEAAQSLRLGRAEVAKLRELGECLNYNAYGESLDDLHFHPADLYRALAPYRDPGPFIAADPAFNVLRRAYAEDLDRTNGLRPYWQSAAAAVYVLPEAAWSRRINGIFGNRLAQNDSGRAHAVLVTKPGGYTVSVRAPTERPRGAAALCEQFQSGGGREGAAGINRLSESEFDRFVVAFQQAFAQP